MAAKARAALTVEGELPEDGLAALDGDGQDVFIALARRLVAPGSDTSESLDELFAGARQIDAGADEVLADGDRADEDSKSVALLPALQLPRDSVASIQQSFFPSEANVGSVHGFEPAGSPTGRVATLEDLARLVLRPRPRRKAAPPVGQLSLFDGR